MLTNAVNLMPQGPKISTVQSSLCLPLRSLQSSLQPYYMLPSTPIEVHLCQTWQTTASKKQALPIAGLCYWWKQVGESHKLRACSSRKCHGSKFWFWTSPVQNRFGSVSEHLFGLNSVHV